MNREALIEQMSEVIVGAFRNGDFGFVEDAFTLSDVPIKLANLAKEYAIEAVKRVKLDKTTGYYDTGYQLAIDDLEAVKQKVIGGL